MCELFAAASDDTITLDVSLEAFAARGDPGGRNRDGFGIAWYAGPAVRLVKEPRPAATSPWMRLLAALTLDTTRAVAHLRRATRGRATVANTQPFVRELGGREHVFAHNGDLPEVERWLAGEPAPCHRPVGDTDSEAAFCALLGRLEPLWRKHSPPPLEARFAVVAGFAAILRKLGPANFVYADGDALFAHGHRRIHRTGDPPRPPGLHLLERRCAAGSTPSRGGGISMDPGSGPRRVALLASVPLTDEPWAALEEGEIIALHRGQVVLRQGPAG